MTILNNFNTSFQPGNKVIVFTQRRPSPIFLKSRAANNHILAKSFKLHAKKNCNYLQNTYTFLSLLLLFVSLRNTALCSESTLSSVIALFRRYGIETKARFVVESNESPFDT